MTASAFKTGVVVTQRTLEKNSGTNGPRHDPYSYEERIVVFNGVEYKLHLGLNCYVSMDGVEILGYGVGLPKCVRGEEVPSLAVRCWEVAIGMTIETFDKAYDRVHPYFEDPFGHPRMYE